MRHVSHLLTRYVHDQLSPAQRARVINHVRTCPDCRAVLAREERLATDLRREMPHFGQPRPAQLAHVWAGVYQDMNTPHHRSRPRNGGGSAWLSGLGVAMAMLLMLMVALPLVAQSEVRAEAAPRQALPVSTASPTAGITDEAPTQRSVTFADNAPALPRATVALVVRVGASPVPMPQATVSPDARTGAY
jgi:hypothetical protein